MKIAKKTLTRLQAVAIACSAFILSACGGGESASSASIESSAQAAIASGMTTMQMAVIAVPADSIAQPTFHAAPALLAEPDGSDAFRNDASAGLAPHKTSISSEVLDVPTSRLSAEDIRSPSSQ